MKLTFKVIVVGCILFLGAATWGVVFRLTECRRINSPDKRFYAVATCCAWRTYFPTVPGNGGDKPGYVTVFTHEGQSCGVAPLPLVQMIDEIKWDSSRAELRLVAEWDLIGHSVHY